MRRTILSLCVLSVLAWAAGNVLAQGKSQGRERAGRPADRVNSNKPGEIVKPDANAPAADAKKSLAQQDMEKASREKAKGLTEQGQKQAQMRVKDATNQVAGKIAETIAKGQNQQARAFDKQAQRDTAKHMERQARLARIRELAVQKGDAKMIARVDELIAKDKHLYERKLEKMRAQSRASASLPPAGMPAPGVQGKDKIDVNKPAEKLPGEAPKPSTEKPNEAKPQ